ncbi:sodium transport system ATP-binding protein [Paucibacter oligotrophus]|uniref:Sodium transport system ATP-binding protein n=1 Tax=Roseateles oligotrophus TaxID=1769250 RepID=A0A840LL61_9BURK|nr:ATP-binding cassette domain-containing protein [Roseateles oligotrophus]MBB4846037.1 sodium transport system ATP-binding protein [Roseateles oligotrophus]
MIQIDNVSKQFASRGGSKPGLSLASLLGKRSAPQLVQAVKDVSVHAPDGRITGLLGANGAGKTTTLRMLGGLFQPDSGSITVDGIAVASQPREALARMGILGDAHGLYPRLSARENIIYFGRLQGMEADAADARAVELARLLEMQHILDRRAEGFSQGERMKTALARALVHDPANIVLDEPTNGLDVLATRALREALRHLRSPAGGAKTIIFSTHIMQEVEQLCEHVVVVAQGRSVAEGSVPELLELAGEARFEDAFVKLAFASAVAEEQKNLRSAA